VRNKTLPLTGPVTRPRKRPLPERNVSAMPFSPQKPISGVETVFTPKQTMFSSVRAGMETFSSPPTLTQIFSLR